MQDRQCQTIPESPRPVHGPLVSILLSTKLVKDVKQTRYSVCDAFYQAKIAVINAKKLGYPCWLSKESAWFQGKCTLFLPLFRQLPKVGIWLLCIICPQHVAACKIHYKSPSRRPDGLTTLDWFTVHEARSTPKIIGILTKVHCTSGPNLVILAWTGDVLSRGQAKNWVNFDFEVKFYPK